MGDGGAARSQEPLSGDALRARFDALGEWLATTSFLWRPRPFVTLPAPWESDEPDLVRWLLGLSAEAIGCLEQGRPVPGIAPRLDALMGHARALSDVAALSDSPRGSGGERGVPARKAAQVMRLAALVAECFQPEDHTQVIDWCSGKGHLGRAIAHQLGLPLHLVEKESRLVSQGLELARGAQIRCTGDVVDALQWTGWLHEGQPQLVVGLHSCGTLGEAMVRGCVAHEVAAMALASCCYHRGHQRASYVPLSARGRASGLVLERDDLRLPTLTLAGRGGRKKHVDWTIFSN